ncbi:hypothetical protein [Microbacterium maritypicum]
MSSFFDYRRNTTYATGSTTQADIDAFADRVLRAQPIAAGIKVNDTTYAALPAEHVASVLHALADHTHNNHMLHIARDRVLSRHGDFAPETDSLGRYFHALADSIERRLGYVVCNRLLDAEQNLHCEYDGLVPLTTSREGRCPWCRGAVREETQR